MKKHVFTMMLATLLLASCSEAPEIRSIKGGYHYKTSGQVTIHQPGQEDNLYTLDNESGQMEVVSLYDDDKLLLTFNQTNGGVYNTHGTSDGATLSFDSFSRTLPLKVVTVHSDTIHTFDPLGLHILSDSIVSITSDETEVFDIEVSGRAEVYENNIIFYLDYNGQSQTSNKTLKGNNIQTLAKKN